MEFVQQTVNFLVLTYALYRILYKPVRKFMDERTASIENQIRAAEEEKAAAVKMRQDLEKQLAEQSRQAKEYIDQAIRRGEALQEEIIAQAKKEADEIRQRAVLDIQLEKDKAWAELKENVVQLSFDLASKMVRASLDQEAHERLIQDTLAKLDESQLGESV
ncbi:MAG TPA: F0F1 ATP synthase subunit B [Firmicutes bacterium]|jgi:F-type H+-transporting ATPase subunit b|nr:F0F1 ATP synthase subunit B [Bacillota bacterium]